MNMTYIVPFEAEFCGKIRKIYSVNNDNPTDGFCSSVTTSEPCPYCGERNFFRVYDHKSEYEEDGWFIEVYDCKCPNCRKEFDLKIEHEY